MSYSVRKASDKLSNSYRTILIYNIILQIDIHCQSVSDSVRQLQNKFIILYLSAIELTCQTMSEKRQTSCRTILIHNIILQIDIHWQSVSDSVRQLQNKFIILYLSAIELTCQTMSDSVRQLQNNMLII